ncbi:YgaP family membrane protein [Kaarinaea lacus]
MTQLIDKSLQNSNALQNLSAIDRSIRIVIGAALVSTWLLADITTVSFWFALLPLVGAIVALSGILGWCPVYAAFGTKSCGVDSHNRCGTLPFQLSELFKSHRPSV